MKALWMETHMAGCRTADRAWFCPRTVDWTGMVASWAVKTDSGPFLFFGLPTLELDRAEPSSAEGKTSRF